jgi:hypothetical protein
MSSKENVLDLNVSIVKHEQEKLENGQEQERRQQ